ncbi:phosphotransferase [Pseudosulfitobacter sp. DSM 107133]|uniref:phosphotransferase enzyme family protein n=1 Tax=Pseudosulfitobacter sp. DSM 107133 TaxID=2883100 RepID=UPI0019659536|nr:phosphotransferase [Pseudosulfitobacter sp. DSM 107133]UOA28953.1 Homoserine kinase [Pseudosulfitobacter sp. DSM 107133]
MNATVEKALGFWGLDGADWQLIAARENQVFRVEGRTGPVALRLHRVNYRSDDELRSELQWMAAVAAGGLHVPEPVRATDGSFLHVIDGVQVDVLGWLTGRPVGTTATPLDVADRTGLFHAIGREMARLHQVSDAWTLPPDFTRCRWDRDGLVGDAPVWGRFWDNPALSQDDRALFTRLRAQADDVLANQSAGLDHGLIHADLVRENLMIDGARIQLIDFDDGGYGYRQFDIATTLLKNMQEPDYVDLRTALIDGYLSVRPIDLTTLDLFLVLRAATYVGWIITRMDEDGAADRCARYAALTRQLAQDYLA